MHYLPDMKRLWQRTDFKTVATQVLRLKQLKARETRAAATRQIGRLVQNFGALPIRSISEESWIEYVQRETEKRPRKFFDDRKYMKMILLHAQSQKLHVKIPPLQIPDLPWDAGREILGDELARLEGTAAATLRFQIRVGWKMGLRLREMLRLRWDQVNWPERVITLRAAHTKTRRSREVPIPADLFAEFCARKAVAKSEWVFPTLTGRGPQESNKTAWRRCKAKAGVVARWHDLRHTCATLLLRRGVPPHIARRYLGMSESVLTRIYVHLSREDLRKAADAMDDRI